MVILLVVLVTHVFIQYLIDNTIAYIYFPNISLEKSVLYEEKFKSRKQLSEKCRWPVGTHCDLSPRSILGQSDALWRVVSFSCMSQSAYDVGKHSWLRVGLSLWLRCVVMYTQGKVGLYLAIHVLTVCWSKNHSFLWENELSVSTDSKHSDAGEPLE